MVLNTVELIGFYLVNVKKFTAIVLNTQIKYMEKLQEQKTLAIPDDLVIQIDGTAFFTINEEGLTQGSYRGVFNLKCYLSPLDSLAASRHYRELLGPYGDSAGEQDRYLAFCVSQLARRVIKGPPWWTATEGQPGNILDLNILSLILDRSLTAEAAYKERLTKMKQEALEKAQNAATALQDSLNPKKNEGEEK